LSEAAIPRGRFLRSPRRAFQFVLQEGSSRWQRVEGCRTSAPHCTTWTAWRITACTTQLHRLWRRVASVEVGPVQALLAGRWPHADAPSGAALHQLPEFLTSSRSGPRRRPHSPRRRRTSSRRPARWAAQSARAADPARGAPPRSTPISGTISPTSL